ncbi:MAG: hypothetical protein GKR87_06185 [Kiritimatiellae bacterium]|nr:hypothetical protein [Kiritimatiellia bacterium]
MDTRSIYILHSTSAVSEDREANLVTEWDVTLSPSVAIYYGFDGAIEEDLYIEASLRHDTELSNGVIANLSGTMAYKDPDQGKDGFSHAIISAGLDFGHINTSISYVEELDDKVLKVDENIFGTVGASYQF